MNFVVVSSVVIKRVECLRTGYRGTSTHPFLKGIGTLSGELTLYKFLCLTSEIGLLLFRVESFILEFGVLERKRKSQKFSPFRKTGGMSAKCI